MEKRGRLFRKAAGANGVINTEMQVIPFMHIYTNCDVMVPISVQEHIAIYSATVIPPSKILLLENGNIGRGIMF